jgi:hypothetical protein
LRFQRVEIFVHGLRRIPKPGTTPLSRDQHRRLIEVDLTRDEIVRMDGF